MTSCEGILPLVSEEMFKRYMLEPWITFSEDYTITLQDRSTAQILRVSEVRRQRVGEEGEKSLLSRMCTELIS